MTVTKRFVGGKRFTVQADQTSTEMHKTGLSFRRGVAIVVLSFAAAGGLVWTATLGAGQRTAAGGDPWADEAPNLAGHAVVVAELFTSEGCLSCPPADEVLSRLVREPVRGTVVLGLGEHVDYWDRFGWRDPFSSSVFSSRQAEYQSHVFQAGSLYTPQLVVDGQFEAIGSDVTAVRRAIASAARIPKAAIDVAAPLVFDGQLSVNVKMDRTPATAIRERADIVVAVTQDHLTSEVRRGENLGRTLLHSAVVRSLTALGSLEPPAATFDRTAIIPVAADWDVQSVGVIAFLQERLSRRIVGTGSARPAARNGPSPLK